MSLSSANLINKYFIYWTAFLLNFHHNFFNVFILFHFFFFSNLEISILCSSFVSITNSQGLHFSPSAHPRFIFQVNSFHPSISPHYTGNFCACKFLQLAQSELLRLFLYLSFWASRWASFEYKPSHKKNIYSHIFIFTLAVLSAKAWK